ncbi:HNH endonuclease family protein [Lyngbya aestuarii BL J]|uniref:HNH endonuclease family protein n=1 Tax=Lyngbya aestuarii BL J TaxID=1348334 RepID=U7QNR4_9CYAN|nr:HNH endonuclease [Lyngbya aestuarii]ERT09624.1 HNH endonuclease family protein [Lyngbya aestuarii BL J]
MTIDQATRELIRQRANYLCEYCHSPEKLSASRFTIDHIIPRSLGGSDQPENLALACRRCNERRYNFTTGFDSETGETVPLFNPRQQRWSDHFVWTADGTNIIGITQIGRATCDRLDLNDNRYNQEDSIRSTRRFWVQVNQHPPQEDSRQTAIE